MIKKLFKPATANGMDTSLLILRVAIGAIFMAHGWQKVFVMGFSGVAGMFGQMGIPAPQVLGPFVSLVELVGGAALIVGLLTRAAAAGLAATMLVAILKVHISKGLTGPGGLELPLSLLAANLALLISGAGRISMDAMVGRKLEGAAQDKEKTQA